MKISFSGYDLILHYSGVLLWPEENILVVSDLHLEKGSYHAGRGYFLPPYDSSETLARLMKVIKSLRCKQIIILGDCFHDSKGYARLNIHDREIFDQLLAYDTIWIKGNHDGDFVPPGFKDFEEYERNGLIFRHEAVPGEAFEISGHYHPKIDVGHHGSYISRRCFAEDQRKLILPAFGAYAGGMSLREEPLKSLFSHPYRSYLLGDNKVYKVEVG